MVLGAWLWLLPVRLIASEARSAELIDPGGPIARRWRLGLIAAIVLTVLHIAIACARGGRIRHFLWPPADPVWLVRRLRQGRLFGEARDAVWEFATALRLPAYFRLGFFGYAGTLAWLLVPVGLLALGRRVPPLGVLGGLLLAIVALVLPFLQAHFAAEGRFAALFEYPGRAAAVPPRSLGVCPDPVPDGTVRPAALPAQDRNDPARNGLATEPGLPRVHLPGPGPDGLGLRPRRHGGSGPGTGSYGERGGW